MLQPTRSPEARELDLQLSRFAHALNGRRHALNGRRHARHRLELEKLELETARGLKKRSLLSQVVAAAALAPLSCSGSGDPGPGNGGPAVTEITQSPGPVTPDESPQSSGPRAAPASVTTQETLLTPDETERNEPIATTVPESCATAKVGSSIAPATLYFVMDISGSMIDDGAQMFRWDPVTIALKSFFSDPASAGLSAAMELFPVRGDDGRFHPAEFCAGETYALADLPPTTLPDTTVSDFIDSIPPGGPTPTVPALDGAFTQADSLMASTNHRAAVVLVTDGEPASCGDYDPPNNIDGAITLVEQWADRIPTYVIGVGDQLQRLHRIAEAGGTSEALIVPTDDPESTRSLIQARLSEIRGAVASCEVEIPAPPVGQELAPGRVAAELETPDGNLTTLQYDPNCADPFGFKYDSLDQPSSIQLCDAACSELQQDRAEVNVLFGCLFELPELR